MRGRFMNNIMVNYTLRENGLDFIYESLKGLVNLNGNSNVDENEKKRILKYSLLHLSSGMELVFKNILLEEHWTYVFQDMNKAQLRFSSSRSSLFFFCQNQAKLKVLHHCSKVSTSK